MLRQRLLAAVIVRKARAVQSFGYKRWLPLGDVACVVENLDRWGADGIVVLSTDCGLKGPDLNLIQRLSKLSLSTPLTYGGGIHTPEQATQAVQAGAERLVLDRVLCNGPEQVKLIASAVGQQALIGSVPLIKNAGGKTEHLQHWCQKRQSLDKWIQVSRWPKHVSEILAIDVNAEGSLQGPDSKLLDELIHLKLPILAFGGFSKAEQISAILQGEGIAAAVIGNALNYQEQTIRTFKEQLKALPLRPHTID